MKVHWKKIIKFITTAIPIFLSLVLFQMLLMPKYMSGVIEGAFIAEYYDETKDHDVLFIGDCEAYENFNPVTLWENFGINSYIRGSAQQLIWQSYYLLEDTLRYETPEVVVLNVLALKYNEPQNEAYNRMSIDGMKWSSSKVGAIKASMTEEESFIDYVFPILRYHSRWKDLSWEDFEYLFHKDKVTHNGYYMRVDIKPVTSIPDGAKLPDYNFGENSYYYLDKIRELCEENNIELLLVKAPSLHPHWYDQWDDQMINYAKEHDLLYINYLDLIDEIGLDFDVDTYDAGLHLNLSGGIKTSNHLGEFLIENYELENRRGELALEKAWEEKIKRYNIDILQQREEIAFEQNELIKR